MPAHRRTGRKAAEEEDGESLSEDENPQYQDKEPSDKAVKEKLEGRAKKMERERTAVLKKVHLHGKGHKERVEAITLKFKESINEAFATFKEDELYINDEIAHYIDVFASTVNALETSMEHILHYLEKRYDGAEATQYQRAVKDKQTLEEDQTRLVREVKAKHATEDIAAAE